MEEREIDKMMQEQVPTGSSGGFLSFVSETIKITLIALAIILPVRYFLIKPFYVNGASMVPTYYDGEYLIVDEITYRFNAPMRGDVIVFEYPEDHTQFFIKRVIGLPGERVVINDGFVIIYNDARPDGMVLEEPYLLPETTTLATVDTTLGEDEFFVLGDNRNHSLDSRRFGVLHADEIIGRAWLRGWPPDRIGVLTHHEFNQ